MGHMSQYQKPREIPRDYVSTINENDTTTNKKRKTNHESLHGVSTKSVIKKSHSHIFHNILSLSKLYNISFKK